MARTPKPVVAPTCPECGKPTHLVPATVLYRHRDDLSDKKVWLCSVCNTYVGCHGKSDRPLGVPANHALRYARMRLHDDRIDPLWKTADQCGLYRPEDEAARRQIRAAARGRVYAFLANRLGIARGQCHTAKFDLETCRAAWRALSGVTYSEIRDWHKAVTEPEELAA